MNTVLTILSLISSIIFIFGLVSLYKDTFFTEYAEMFVHKNGFFLSGVFLLNTIVVCIGSVLDAFLIGQVYILTIYVVLTLVLVGAYIYETYKGTLK